MNRLCISFAISPLQITTTHSGRALGSDEALLQLSAQESPYVLVGSVEGSTPVLHELSGAVFKQHVPLSGTLLFYRAKPSDASLLPTVLGKERPPLPFQSSLI